MEPLPSNFDAAWKEALERYSEAFFAFFFPMAHAEIDWAAGVEFRESELQQVAPERNTGLERVDKLLRVMLLDGTPTWVFVHIEVQSQHDPLFAQRMFRYHARLFDRDQQQVISLAVLGDEDRRWLPSAFGYERWDCALSLRFPIVKLCALDLTVLEMTRNPFATLSLLHRDAQETRYTPDERALRKIARYRALLRQGYRSDDIRSLLRLMEFLLRLPPDRIAPTRDAMKLVEEEELGMTQIITSFEELGRAEGRVEAQRDIVLRQLQRKLGLLPSETQARVTQLAEDQMLHLSDALLDFTHLDELIAWLDQHAPTGAV